MAQHELTDELVTEAEMTLSEKLTKPVSTKAQARRDRLVKRQNLEVPRIATAPHFEKGLVLGHPKKGKKKRKLKVDVDREIATHLQHEAERRAKFHRCKQAEDSIHNVMQAICFIPDLSRKGNHAKMYCLKCRHFCGWRHFATLPAASVLMPCGEHVGSVCPGRKYLTMKQQERIATSESGE